MSCHEFETLLALYVEDDLDEFERQRVVSHLQNCIACRRLREDLEASQVAFKSIRQDGPDQTTLSAIRSRVLDEVSGKESGTWFERLFPGGFRQRATLAGLALVLVGSGVLLLWPRPAEEPAGAPPIVAVPPVATMPAVVSVQEAPRPQPSAVPVRKPRTGASRPDPVPAQAEPQPQVTIRLVTDDPTVIIYWLGDEKGD